jgi:hypothetical protein
MTRIDKKHHHFSFHNIMDWTSVHNSASHGNVGHSCSASQVRSCSMSTVNVPNSRVRTPLSGAAPASKDVSLRSFFYEHQAHNKLDELPTRLC